jgi:hypothetical protein
MEPEFTQSRAALVLLNEKVLRHLRTPAPALAASRDQPPAPKHSAHWMVARARS